MPSIVLNVSQGPAANCKAFFFSFLIMMHNFKGIMSSNHLLKSVSCCPSCLLTGVLNCRVGFHVTTLPFSQVQFRSFSKGRRHM